MNTIGISDRIILNHCDDIEAPLVIHMYGHPEYREKQFTIKEVRMAIQIFHIDLKHFDLRKAVLIDADERRPIYGFVFDDFKKQMAFFAKRHQYMMASQQVELIEVDRKLAVGAVRNMGNSLYRLRAFCSWMEHLAGRGGEGVFTKDCVVTTSEGATALTVPDLTIEDLISCLKGEKTLVKKEFDLDDEFSKTTVDGVKMTPAEFAKHMSKKAILERLEEVALN